jgi:hypothetical protein
MFIFTRYATKDRVKELMKVYEDNPDDDFCQSLHGKDIYSAYTSFVDGMGFDGLQLDCPTKLLNNCNKEYKFRE